MKTDAFFCLLDQMLAAGEAEAGSSYRLPLAAYYDSIPTSPDELAFNLRLAAQCAGADVLELAVGTRRVAIPLAQAGRRIVGLDLAPDMLALCRQKAEAAGVLGRLELLEGDMTNFALGRQFGLILIPNGSIIYLDAGQRQALFRCVAAHLAPGGTFAFSALAGEVPEAYGPFVSQVLRLPGQRGVVTQLAAMRRVAPQRQEVRILCTEIQGGAARVWVTREYEQTTTPDQVTAELQAAGLKVDGLHSDFGCTGFDPAAEDLIVVARHA